MSRQQRTTHEVAHRLDELATEFGGWRVGRGGSGHWWAVRGDEIVRTLSVDELRARLHELSDPPVADLANTPRLSGGDVVRVT